QRFPIASAGGVLQATRQRGAGVRSPLFLLTDSRQPFLLAALLLLFALEDHELLGLAACLFCSSLTAAFVFAPLPFFGLLTGRLFRGDASLFVDQPPPFLIEPPAFVEQAAMFLGQLMALLILPPYVGQDDTDRQNDEQHGGQRQRRPYENRGTRFRQGDGSRRPRRVGQFPREAAEVREVVDGWTIPIQSPAIGAARGGAAWRRGGNRRGHPRGRPSGDGGR